MVQVKNQPEYQRQYRVKFRLAGNREARGQFYLVKGAASVSHRKVRYIPRLKRLQWKLQIRNSEDNKTLLDKRR